MNMKRIVTLVVCCVMLIGIKAMACTGLIAGKLATTDGSALVTYAADSHTLYGELYNQPAADYPKGAMRKVIEWDTGKYLGGTCHGELFIAVLLVNHFAGISVYKNCRFCRCTQGRNGKLIQKNRKYY